MILAPMLASWRSGFDRGQAGAARVALGQVAERERVGEPELLGLSQCGA